MSDYENSRAALDEQNRTSIESIKARIADVNSKNLEDHSEEYEAIHASLQRALAEIDGI